MRNWHYIVGGIITLLCAQGYYLAWWVADWYDLENGISWLLPPGYTNPFERMPQIARCGLELCLVSIVAHTAINTKTNAFVKALWVFIGLSAWNQFVDACFGDMYNFSISELVFLIFSIGVSILTYIKWQKKQSGS